MGKIGARLDNKKALRGQMQEREQLKQDAYQEYLKEKQAVDAAMKRLAEEDRTEAARQAEKRKTMQEFMERSMLDKTEVKRRTKEDEVRSMEKIKRYQEEADRREAQLKVKKAEEDAAKEEIFKKLNDEEVKRRTEKEYIENLRIDLMQEEHEEAARVKELQESGKREK